MNTALVRRKVPERIDDPRVGEILARHAGRRGSLLPILHDVQDSLGYVPDSVVAQIARAIQRSRAEIHGVLRFYPHFRREAPARVQVAVCRAESCQAREGNALYAHAEAAIAALPPGQASLAPVYCLGLCSQSPALMINGQVHARMTPESFDGLLRAAVES